ncbi:MAG: hypothetical protein RIC38_16905, partial [Chromatocurvus sp.]
MMYSLYMPSTRSGTGGRFAVTVLLLCLAVASVSADCPPQGEALAVAGYSREDVLAGRTPRSAAVARATLSIAGERIEAAIVTDAARDQLSGDWPPLRRQTRLMLVALASGDVLWELVLSPQEASHATHASDPRLIAPLGAAAVLSGADGVARRLYAGDRAGRVWRVDLPPLARAADAATDWQVDLLADLARPGAQRSVRFSLAPDLVRSV